MLEAHYRVQVERDHLRKLANATPIQAVAELIWNSVDADATRVDLEIDSDGVAMRSVTIRDNGHGIPHTNVETLFGKLGGSWKAHGSRSKTKGRMLHGKEGKGRFKALALGRVADWTVRYQDGHKLLGYKITIIRDDLVDVRVTEPNELETALGTGVEVRVTELDRSFRSLESQNAVQSLSEIFALYLTDYSDVAIFVEGKRLDPSKMISSRETIGLSPIVEDGKEFPAEVEVIQWKSASERWFFLCGPQGFPFLFVTPKFHTPGFQFSAYLKSPFVDMLQSQGLLDLAEMNAPLQAAYDEASERIKAHFQTKQVEAAQAKIEQWKAEKVYPYSSEPVTPVEKAERKVFDIVALNVNRHLPDFAEQSKRTKSFQMRMLRQAIERGPDELQHILTEVLDLPPRTQTELAKLLEDASLANVISASRLVADRLKFVHGLEAVLFDTESKSLLKERSQLHRMISDNNTWIFGEEFNLTVDDESLTEVLRKHRKLIGAETVIDQPVRRIDGKTGIVDLMLSRSVPQNHADEREHLVVELKRPSVKIGPDEITQVKRYAYTVADDERFRSLKTRWSFWVISNDLDPFARVEARQKGKPPGQIFQSEDGRVEVWVKAWAEIIAESKSRMRFVQDHLQANVDKESSLKYLKRTYAKYLAGIAEIDDPADQDEETQEGASS
jgi:Histidine kinase-, DNA gyrase B-, and HSP90-like ATPase